MGAFPLVASSPPDFLLPVLRNGLAVPLLFRGRRWGKMDMVALLRHHESVNQLQVSLVENATGEKPY
jgi:hypothetical protein